MWNNKDHHNEAIIKSTIACRAKAQKREEEYFKHPKLCKTCKQPLPYKKRLHYVFCCKSCSAIYNNSIRSQKTTTTNCIRCNKSFKNLYGKRRYCSPECSTKHKSEKAWAIKREAIERGEKNLSLNIESNNTFFKRYLIEQHGAKCMRCGWQEINKFSNRIPIELEHKDGNCTNNNIDNLELLCPNCHSLTATYKGANKRPGGSKRYQVWKTYFTK
jgi:endogenous inhibitor of DNA gyrase (YacG/DUF329 family)